MIPPQKPRSRREKKKSAKNGELGRVPKPRTQPPDGRSRSGLQRALDLQWLAGELATSTDIDDLLRRYNARVIESRLAVLEAQGMEPDKAAALAIRQAIKRPTLEREIGLLQQAAEQAAIKRTRDEWLAEGIRSAEENRQALRAIRERAHREFDQAPAGEKNPQFLAIAAATVPAESRLMNEILGYQGVREITQLPAGLLTALPGGEGAEAVLDLTRRLPEKAGQLVHVLGQLLNQAKRTERANSPPKESVHLAGTPPVGVVWNVTRKSETTDGGGN